MNKQDNKKKDLLLDLGDMWDLKIDDIGDILSPDPNTSILNIKDKVIEIIDFINAMGMKYGGKETDEQFKKLERWIVKK